MTQEYREHPEPTGEGEDAQPASDEDLQDLADDGGPDVSELDDEPDYNPDDEGLKDLKGG